MLLFITLKDNGKPSWRLMMLLYALIVGTLRVVPVNSSPTCTQQGLPCKIFNTTHLDCRNRRLLCVPELPRSIALASADIADNKLRVLNKDDLSSPAQTDLIRLDLSRNVLTNITGAPFGGMTSLRFLNLSSNRLSHLDDEVFHGLTSLVTLDLAYNNLAVLPDNIFKDLLRLNILDLSSNQFKSRAPGEALSSLHELRSLDINLMDLNGTVFDTNFNHLGNLTKMTLTSDSSNLTLSRDLFINLYDLPLTDLVISLPDVHLVEERVFGPLRNLMRLRVDGVGVGILDALAFLNVSAIETLQLSGWRNVTIAGQDDLSANMLMPLENISLLRTLSLSYFGFFRVADYAFVWVPSLRKLDLSHNSIFILYEDAFAELYFLEELDLSYNGLDEPYYALRVLGPSLRVLNLGGNWITGDWLPEMLQSVPHLTHLNLEWNQIEYLYDPFSPSDVANLTDLNLSGNHFDSLPPWGWTMPFPALTTFQYTNINIELILTSTEFAVLAPKLENVDFRSTSYAVMSIHSCSNLRQIDLSRDGETTSERFHDEWLRMDFPVLRTLNLSHNLLSYLNDSTFAHSLQIRTLDLSYNIIKTVSSGTFDHLKQLQYLNLMENRINTVASTLTSVITLPSLQYLNVAYNNIAEIPESFFRSLTARPTRRNVTSFSLPSILHLDFSGNPFLCSCSIQSMQDWFQLDNIIFVESFPDYVCSAPNSTRGLIITEVSLGSECEPPPPIRTGLYVSIAAAFLIVSCLAVFLCVRYHWHLRYIRFLIFNSSNVPPRMTEGRMTEDGAAYCRYDAFVSYNEKDETWVFDQLMPNMEGSSEDDSSSREDKFRLCIGARDFVLGGCILEAILEGVGQSHKTMMILSPNFVESEWCHYEMQSAQLSLFHEGRDVLVLVLLEEIPDSKLPLLLRRILCSKNTLKWPSDKVGQDLFWRRLREELKKPSHVNRRYEA